MKFNGLMKRAAPMSGGARQILPLEPAARAGRRVKS